MEHQQIISYQLDLFERRGVNVISSSDSGEGVTQTTARKAKQVNVAGLHRRALAENLMEIICSTSNLKRAYRQVKRNKGVAGIDCLPVGKFPDWYRKH